MGEQQDRLAEFKAYRDELYGKNLVGPKDLIDIRVDALDWLIGEVERLRGRLRELEWINPCDGCDQGTCPVCGGHDPEGGRGHEPDCWLAAETSEP